MSWNGVSDSRGSGNRVTGSRVSKNRFAGSRGSGNGVTGSRVSGNRFAGSRVSRNRVACSRVSGSTVTSLEISSPVTWSFPLLLGYGSLWSQELENEGISYVTFRNMESVV